MTYNKTCAAGLWARMGKEDLGNLKMRKRDMYLSYLAFQIKCPLYQNVTLSCYSKS